MKMCQRDPSPRSTGVLIVMVMISHGRGHPIAMVRAVIKVVTNGGLPIPHGSGHGGGIRVIGVLAMAMGRLLGLIVKDPIEAWEKARAINGGLAALAVPRHHGPIPEGKPPVRRVRRVVKRTPTVAHMSVEDM